MPDDYYVSQYSGEEIDERLTAAHNAVRYDAAQTLNDAQKTQARANIAAAPKGFGLGDVWNVAPSRDADLITGSGFQMAVLNTPTGNSWWGILSFIYDANTATQWAMSQNDASYYGSVCKREKRAGTWSPWEYVNPSLALGVEYRTTERYLGKPVYVKAVSVSSFPLGGLANRISVNTGISTADVDTVVRWGGFGSNGGKYIIGFPATFDDDNVIAISGYLYKQESLVVYIQSSGTDFSAYSGTLWLAYTKTTN